MAEVETVQMSDGRLVEFAGKREVLKESWEANGQVFTRLDFRNGETRTFPIPEALLLKFAAHGAEQKLGDEYAGLKEIEDKVQAVDELIARLNAGKFNTVREGGGTRASGGSVLAKALVEVTGKNLEEIKNWLSERTVAEKNALRADAKIAPVIARLEAERAAKAGSEVDADELLDSLGL
jgi:uncharacterized small protein (DUF1192 family)